MCKLPLNDKMLELVARRFRAMGEPTRLRILQLLETGEKSVGELVDGLDTSQPNASKHLQALAAAGLVTRRREGNSIYYAIADPVVYKLCDLVCRSTTRNLEKQFEILLPRRRAS